MPPQELTRLIEERDTLRLKWRELDQIQHSAPAVSTDEKERDSLLLETQLVTRYIALLQERIGRNIDLDNIKD